jgi:hypothetical protein
MLPIHCAGLSLTNNQAKPHSGQVKLGKYLDPKDDFCETSKSESYLMSLCDPNVGVMYRCFHKYLVIINK